MKSKRIAYIRQNKEEIDNQTQKKLISRHEVHNYVYEDVTKNPDSKEELYKLLDNIGDKETIIVAECGVISDIGEDFARIHDVIESKGATLFCVREGYYTGEQRMKTLIESIKASATAQGKMQSYRQAEAAYVPKPKKTVQHLFETVPSNPTKTRVLISDETSNSVLQMVADKKLTQAEAAKKLGVGETTIHRAFKNKLATGEIVKKTASEIKIEKAKAILPSNWNRLYSGYMSGNLKISDMTTASKLKECQVRDLIKYQKAGLLSQ